MRKKIYSNIQRLLWRIRRALSSEELRLFDLSNGLKVKYPISTAIGFALSRNDFETTELDYLLHYLEPGQIFFDIGANGGIFSVTAAKCVGKQGHVFAFEPGEYEYALLKENVQLNNLNNVTIIKKAVSDSNGIRRFAKAHDGAFSSLSKTFHPDQHIENWVEVETISLDTFVVENGIESVDFIKIDVEGAEKLVFDGASNLLKNNPRVCILFEAYELNIRGFGYSVQSFFESLHRDGFHIFFFKGADWLHHVTSFQPEFGGKLIQNFIATRRPEMLTKKGYKICS